MVKKGQKNNKPLRLTVTLQPCAKPLSLQANPQS